MIKDRPAASVELKRLRELTGMSIRQVAPLVGKSASGYAHYENEFKDEHLPWWLVKALIPVFKPHGVRPEQLRALAEERDTDEVVSPNESPVSDPPVSIPSIENRLHSYAARDLPVYGAALGGDGAVIMLNRGERMDTVSRPGTLVGVRDAFGVVIVGDSMLPMYKPGHIAHIHPGRPPIPGEGVLIELHDGHAHIKEYTNGSDDVIRCRQYNPPQTVTFKRRDVKRLYLIVGSGIYG